MGHGGWGEKGSCVFPKSPPSFRNIQRCETGIEKYRNRNIVRFPGGGLKKTVGIIRVFPETDQLPPTATKSHCQDKNENHQ